MNARAKILSLLLAALVCLAVSCKREEGSNRENATTTTDVALTQAGATDTRYVGGGGDVTTSTVPTSTDTSGTTATTSTAGTADVGAASKAAKATNEPGAHGSAPGKKH